MCDDSSAARRLKPLASRQINLKNLQEIGSILNIAGFLSRYMPRGKGAIPRYLGRTFLKPGKFYFVTRHGARLIADPHCLDVFVTMRAAGNVWDYEDFMICCGLVPDGGTFYDVGANVGYFSIEMSAISKGAIAVVAFEPVTALAEALRLSADICNFANVCVFNAMVGDRSGEAEFYLACSSIHGSAVPDSGRDVVKTSLKPIVAIDDLIDSKEVPPPDVVKADIEGSEHLMFEGAKRTFRRYAPHIFIEYLPEFDRGLRIRKQVELLANEVASYEIFGYPNLSVKATFPHKLFQIKNASDWNLVHGVVLRNRDMAVHDEGMFRLNSSDSSALTFSGSS